MSSTLSSLKTGVGLCGNFSWYPADENVYDCENNGFAKLVLPGQGIIYDWLTGVTLGTGATRADHPKIIIGVGVDESGDGVSDYIRPVTSDYIDGCNISNAFVGDSLCGKPHITARLFKCTSCKESYSVTIAEESNFSQSFSPMNNPVQYGPYTAYSDCCDCENDDCNPSHDCRETVCQLVRKINGYVKEPKGSVYNHQYWRKGEGGDAPGKAIMLFAESPLQTFCFTGEDSACNSCVSIPLVKGMTYTDNVTDPENPVTVTHAFTHNVDPADPTKTLVTQLPGIVNQINKILGEDGSKGGAWLTDNTGCCNRAIYVSTCDTAFTITDTADVALVPCDTVQLFDPIDVDNDCKGCDGTDGTVTYSCGLVFIPDPLDLDCFCLPGDNTPSNFLKRFSIYADGFSDCGGTREVIVQEGEVPTNIGQQLEVQELFQNTGGMGRTYSRSTIRGGKWGMPRKNSFERQGTIKCKERYCTYTLQERRTSYNEVSMVNSRNIQGTLAIPKGDTVTKTEFEAFWQGYVGANPAEPNGCALPAIVCPD